MQHERLSRIFLNLNSLSAFMSLHLWTIAGIMMKALQICPCQQCMSGTVGSLPFLPLSPVAPAGSMLNLT